MRACSEDPAECDLSPALLASADTRSEAPTLAAPPALPVPSSSEVPSPAGPWALRGDRARGTAGVMEPFFRKRLAFLSSFWDKIWPAGAPDGGIPRFPSPDRDSGMEPLASESPASESPAAELPAAEPSSPRVQGQLVRAQCDFSARCVDELSVSRGDRLYALREEGDYIFARRLSGPPSMGLVPTACVARATPETLSDQP